MPGARRRAASSSVQVALRGHRVGQLVAGCRQLGVEVLAYHRLRGRDVAAVRRVDAGPARPWCGRRPRRRTVHRLGGADGSAARSRSSRSSSTSRSRTWPSSDGDPAAARRAAVRPSPGRPAVRTPSARCAAGAPPPASGAPSRAGRGAPAGPARGTPSRCRARWARTASPAGSFGPHRPDGPGGRDVRCRGRGGTERAHRLGRQPALDRAGARPAPRRRRRSPSSVPSRLSTSSSRKRAATCGPSSTDTVSSVSSATVRPSGAGPGYGRRSVRSVATGSTSAPRVTPRTRSVSVARRRRGVVQRQAYLVAHGRVVRRPRAPFSAGQLEVPAVVDAALAPAQRHLRAGQPQVAGVVVDGGVRRSAARPAPRPPTLAAPTPARSGSRYSPCTRSLRSTSR